MLLEIVTPSKKVFEGKVSVVTLPGAEGSFQVLNDHAPLISTLEEGQLTYKTSSGETDTFVITGGVAEVLNNKIVVLADGLLEETK
ncbi:ATP synthase F1 subunit epsilon [Fulvivirga maritima]|uniref:ATP synthase F1 subunit epsilon n=1 Tax=Fulvivirga maritima TaxID=2904247 RepID=UPI001F17052A|nr:ATP synthase F1 subunit epsilon [Fulvivirga maritima]UII28688.1 ATP synthase F1 subunit epsilon [Fulvivirga maritima]